MIGTTLAHYEITAKLGQGGMGSVWRARDTKLGREVAIKTLPDEFAEDADRVARFQREAKLLASLNHPNIAAIHGLEEADGKHFLVLELVEGDTIADRIQSGPVEIEEALKLGLQIAEALEAAHDKGVVHRDLKPANIKITPDGKVKVLDFGLAKALTGETEDANLSQSPTLSMAATQQGVILGTASYMSPEQAKGRATDKRTDIWAFGCVLYEMITGRQSFGASDVSEALAAVIRAEPEWNTLPANIHPRLREVLERCLEKDVKRRYHDVADVRVDIEKVLGDPSGVIAEPVAEVVQAAPPSKLMWIGAIVVIAAITGLTVWTLKPAPPTDPRRVSRHDYDLPDGIFFNNVGREVIAVAPDGQSYVYIGTNGLYLRSMNALDAELIVGTVGDGTEGDVTNPFFSPDSQWIGYWRREGRIEKLAISGGTPVPIAAVAENPTGISWGPDDMVLFAQADGIYSVSANSGSPERVIEAEGGEVLAGPTYLPDGKGILFTAASGPGNWDTSEIVVASSNATRDRTVVWNGRGAHYLSTGHLIYALDDDLFAIAFDLDTLAVSGTAVSLVPGLARAGLSGSANYGVSDDGSLVYSTGAVGGGEVSMVWVDREGDESVVGAEPRNYLYPRISPDGDRVALDVRGEQNDILVWEFERNTTTRLTPTGVNEVYPVWSVDGQQIAYGSGEELLWKASDGSGDAEVIFQGGDMDPYFFSLSGTELVFRGVGPNGEAVGMVPIDGASDPTWLLDSEFSERNAELSPDGNWMAYQSDESGRYEILVSPFPESNTGKEVVSSSGGLYPVWARDGGELFYIEPGPPLRLMAVPVETVPDFDLGTPEAVMEWEYQFGAGGRSYDVSADGRFLVLKAERDGNLAPQQIITVLNWFEELKERVPVP